MLNIFKKKSEQATTTKAIAHLPIDTRETIISMRENGLMPAQIAEELDLTPEQVSRVLYMERAKIDRRNNYAVAGDDELSKLNLEIKRADLEMKQMEKQWAMEDRKRERELYLQEMLNPDEEEQDPMQVMAMAFMAKVMGGNPEPSLASFPGPGTPQTVQQGHTPAPAGSVELTDEELQDTIMAYGKHLQQFQKLPDSVLTKFATNQFPQLSQDTIKRAVQIIKKSRFK